MKGLKSKNGISLIVLVITIIVMIILATAIILSLNSSNIVEKAKEATAASDLANAKNVVILAKGEWELMTAAERTSKGGSFVTYAESKLKEAGYSDEFISDLEVNEDGTLGTPLPKIPQGFVASIYEGETKVKDGLVIYETNSLSGISHETAMTTYNQYVWVPVEDINEFVLREGYTGSGIALGVEPYSVDDIETGTNDITGEYAEYAAMRQSVEENGGFYVSRYEASVQETSVLSKQGLDVWSGYWGDNGSFEAVGTNGAVYYARSAYPEAANKGVVSTLIYGVQWDAVMNFMKDVDNPNVEGKKYIYDSTGMGNYEGSYAKTGSNDAYMVKNIYDMAGNRWEWTMEANEDSVWDRIHRGGGLNDAVASGTFGAYYPASSREMGYAMTLSGNVCGIRVALYID